MKKKMAIVLSLVLACSMSMTAFAAPSPSLNTGNTPVSQVTVDQSVATATAGTAESTVSGVALSLIHIYLPPLPLQRYGLDNIHRLCCSAELAG